MSTSKSGLEKPLDTKKLTMLGWEAKVNLDEGIKKTINILKKENKKFS